MRVVIIDGHNFMHRARAGFSKGDYSIVYTFFRNLRALTEQFNPAHLVFVLEGHPQHRYDILPEYKANRWAEPGTEKHDQNCDFHRQKRLIVGLLSECFPILTVKHPHHECDDTIYNIVRQGNPDTEFVVVSNDSDFTQLLQSFDNVKLYNPMKKTFVSPPSYDYIAWKALVGDGSDNIEGFKGIGGKRAQGLLEITGALEKFFKEDSSRAEKFNRNHQLIKFAIWSEDETTMVQCSSPKQDWETCRSRFTEWGFESILKDGPWTRFISTFDKLWPGFQEFNVV